MSVSRNIYAALSLEEDSEAEAQIRHSMPAVELETIHATSDDSTTQAEDDGGFTTVGPRRTQASPEARAARAAEDQAERDRIIESGEAKPLDPIHHSPSEYLAQQAREARRQQANREREARRQAAAERREANHQAFLVRQANRERQQAEWEVREANRQRQAAEHQAYLVRKAKREEREARQAANEKRKEEQAAQEKEEEEKRNQASLLDFARPARGQQRRR